MSRSSCSVCESPNFSLQGFINNYQILKCRRCGFMFADIDFQDFDFKNYYSEYYFEKVHKDGYDGYVGYEDYIKNRLTKWPEYKSGYEEQIKKIERFVSCGRLLEVGCAAGFLLKVARERGWDCYGIEISEYTSRYAREKLNLSVRQVTIENTNFPQGHFDVICCYQTIEHMVQPDIFLREATKILKKGGYIVISTIDFGSWYARFLRLLRISYEMLRPPEHISYFSRKTLSLMLERYGFQVVHFETEKALEDRLDKFYFFDQKTLDKSRRKVLRVIVSVCAMPFKSFLKKFYVDDKIIVYAKKVGR